MPDIILPFDTETTGLYRKNSPLTSPDQPHLVSLSALQVRTNDLYIMQSMSKVVQPDGYEWDDSETSSDRAFAVHKLSMDYCLDYGRSEKEVLDEFLHLWNEGKSHVVAHNLAFDAGLIAVAIARYYGQGELLKAWVSSEGTCTMQSSKIMVDARNAKGHKKSPNLAEAYEFFTGEALTDHHSANRDAVAALQIWVGIQEHDAG